MKKILVSEKEELKELIGNIRINNRFRYFIFGSFLLLSFILKWANIEIPWVIIEIIALLLFSNVLCEYLTKKIWSKQTLSQASLGYFVTQMIEVAALLIAIRFYEAILFGGIAVLMVYTMFCYLTFTREIYSRIIGLFSVIGYIIVALLEYFEVIAFLNIHNIGINPFQNQSLFITVMSFMIGFFICFAFYGDVFSKRLRDTITVIKAKAGQLSKKEEELRETKSTLEIRVEARTKELKELTETLNRQVRQRTKELQEKVEELEKFHKLAVGRELKMIELKKEIKKLKELLKSK